MFVVFLLTFKNIPERKTDCKLFFVFFADILLFCQYIQKQRLKLYNIYKPYIYIIYHIIVFIPWTIRPYFVRQRKTAFLGEVIVYVLILSWGGISILGDSYPHFVFLYGYDYSCFRLKIAVYSFKKLQYS